MEIQVLGSGTALHRAHRSSASLALFPGGACAPIIVDVGSGSLLRMAQAGIAFERLRHVFVTHIHPDHHGDLVPLLFAKRSPLLSENTPLALHGGPGFVELVDALGAIYGKWIDGAGYGLAVHGHRDGDEVALGDAAGGLVVRAGRVEHIPSSLAYRFDDRRSGASVVVSGDTGPSDDLARLARGASLLVLECSFGDADAVPRHLSPSSCAHIAAEAGARSVLLTHFYPGTDALPLAELVREAGYDGPVTIASDLLRIAVAPDGALSLSPIGSRTP